MHFMFLINPVLWIWPQVLIHIIMDFSLIKHLGKKIIWHGKYRPDFGHCTHHLRPGEEGLFVRSIMNLPPPCGEKLFSRVTVRKEEYGGEYKVINCG